MKTNPVQSQNTTILKSCKYQSASIIKYSRFLLVLAPLFVFKLCLYGQMNMSLHPNVGIRTNSPVFAGDNLKIMATGGSTYTWSGPNGYSSTSKSDVIASASSNNIGTYYCTITDLETNTTTILSTVVTVLPVSVSNIQSLPIICEHSDLPLVAPAGGVTYNWSDNLAPAWTPSGQSITYSNVTGIGTHIISCEITDNNNITTTEVKNVEVWDCCLPGPATLLHNTKISVAPTPANATPYVVLGNLNIDVNYTLSPSITNRIHLCKDAMIEINNSTTFTVNNAGFDGCEGISLWYGIYLNDNSEIFLQPANISHSYNGVIVDDHQNTGIRLIGSHFVDNGNGIFINNAFTNPLFVFTSTEFSGSFFNQTPVLLPAPLAGKAPFSGIYSKNSVLWPPNSEENSPNSFFNMENGIYSLGRMNIFIKSRFAKFYNFNTIYPNPIDPGHGIFIDGPGTLTKYGNSNNAFKDFSNCRMGIESIKADVYIRDNYMDYMNTGVLLTRNISGNSSIIKNEMYVTNNGITLNYNDNVNTLLVDSNKITIDNPSASDWFGACILINETKNPINTGGYEKITANDLYVESAHVGISSSGANGTFINGNIIHLNQPFINIAGIQLTNCENNVVTSNYVYGIDRTLGDINYLTPQGLTVESTINSTYGCNRFNDLYVGAGFYDYCNRSIIKLNEFFNHNIGLYYNDYANTADQTFYCNKWDGNYVTFKAKHAGIPQVVLNSLYFVNTIPSNTDPLPNVDATTTWFYETQGSGACPSNCGVGGGGGGHSSSSMIIPEINAIDSIVAQNGLPYESYSSELHWKDGKTLLNTIEGNDSLIENNSLMQHFIDSVQFQSLGLFQAVESLKKDIFYLTPVNSNFILNLSNQINSLNDSIHRIDSLLQTGLGSTDSLILVTQLTNITSTFNDLISQKGTALAGFHALADSNVNFVIDKNGVLPSGEIFEQNEKTFNDIYLNTIAKNILKFSPAQQHNLLDIASQCSLAGGEAVYLARSLYSIIKDTIFDDKNLCLQIGIIKSNEVKPKPNENLSFKFYPNPTSDQIALTWNTMVTDQAELLILNSLGKTILTQSFSLLQGGYQVNLSDIKSGIYYVQIKTRDSKFNLGKLVIVK